MKSSLALSLMVLCLSVACTSVPTTEGPMGILTHEVEVLPAERAIAFIRSDVYTEQCVTEYARATSILKWMGVVTTTTTIVLDLDETVFSGVGFNESLVEAGVSYSPARQLEYMEGHLYPLVPGARGFILYAESLGFTIGFVTNRKESLSVVTATHLDHYGLGHIPVLFRTGTKVKRDRIDSFTNVVMTVGDKDNDHLEGAQQVYLPNPLY